MVKELKAPTTYEEQISILKRRGCVIPDEDFCRRKLQEINYYRLTAYFLPFRAADGTYRDGTNFQSVYRIYEFDRKLRGILFSAVEEVEVYLRSRFAYHHAHQYGALGYLSPRNFSSLHDSTKFRQTLQREIESNRKVPFVSHHLEQYNGAFPIWVASELFTFGMLSYFFADMKTSDQKQLAAELYSTVPKNVISWLRCCTDLRNICAHYGRLYYRVFSAAPAGFDLRDAAKRRLWGTVLSLRALYPDSEKWNRSILLSLEALFDAYREDISLYHIAFPDNWLELLKK